MFEMRDKKTGETLASNLTLDGVDAWWKKNESEWFGVEVDGNVIFVVKVPAEVTL